MSGRKYTILKAIFVLMILTTTTVYAIQEYGTDSSNTRHADQGQGYITTSRDSKVFNATATDLQNAIWYLNDTGGKVYIPRDEIVSTSNISMRGDVTLIGVNSRFSKIRFDGCNGIDIKEVAAGDNMGGLYDLHISEYSVSTTDTYGVRVQNSDHFIIENCWITGFNTTILYVGSAHHCAILNSNIGFSREYCVKYMYNGVVGEQPNFCLIDNCDFNPGTYGIEGTAAIYIQNGSGGTISNSFFETGATIYTQHNLIIKDHAWKFENNRFGAYCNSSCVYINPANHNTIKGTVFNNCKIYGFDGDSVYINADNASNYPWVEFSNCRIYGSGSINASTSSNIDFYMKIHDCVFAPDTANAQTNNLLRLVGGRNIISDNTFFGRNASFDNIVGDGDCTYSEITGNYLSGGKIGISMDDAEYCTINDNIVLNSGNIGIQAYKYSTVNDNVVISAGNDGISLEGNDNVVCGNYIYESTGRGIDGKGSTIYANNNIDNPTGAAIYTTGVDSIIMNNIGYKTEEWGAATIADGGTINHNLTETPTTIIVTCTVAAEMASVTAKDATDFTVAIKDHAGNAGTSQTVYWHAVYYP